MKLKGKKILSLSTHTVFHFSIVEHHVMNGVLILLCHFHSAKQKEKKQTYLAKQTNRQKRDNLRDKKKSTSWTIQLAPLQLINLWFESIWMSFLLLIRIELVIERSVRIRCQLLAVLFYHLLSPMHLPTFSKDLQYRWPATVQLHLKPRTKAIFAATTINNSNMLQVM